MDLTKSTVKIFGSRTAGMAVNFIGITYFSRELGAFQIGVFFLFQALLNLLSMVADLGIRSAMEKRISEGNPAGRVLTTAGVMKLLPVSAVAVLILLVRTYLNEYVGQEVAVVLVAAIVFHELGHLAVQTLNGELRVGETALLLFAQRVAWVALGVLLIIIGFEALGLVYALVGSYVVLTIWGFWRASVGLAWPSREMARSLFDFAKFSALTAAGWQVFNWIDVLVIGMFLAQNFVGAYEIAWKVAGMTLLLVASIRTVIFPQMSAWEAEGNIGEVETLLPKALLGSSFFVVPAFFGSLLLSREILVLVFGEEYRIVAVVLVVLMLQKLVQATNAVVSQSLQAVNFPKLVAVAMFVGAFANVMLNFAFVPRFGVVGAAVATFSSYLLMTSLKVHYLARYISIEVPVAELSWYVIASIVMLGPILLVKTTIGIDTFYDLFATVVLGVAVYLSASALHPTIRSKMIGNYRSVLT